MVYKWEMVREWVRRREGMVREIFDSCSREHDFSEVERTLEQMAFEISLADQIKAVKREIALRKSAYPKWVANGRMKQDVADREIAVMEAVLETLEDWDQSQILTYQGTKMVFDEPYESPSDNEPNRDIKQRDSESSWDYDQRTREARETREGIKGWDI